jgi:hypothetical protein
MLKLNHVQDFVRTAGKRHGRKAGVVACLLAALILIPSLATGQFGLDPCCAVISVGLNTISQLLKSVVAQPLSEIQQIEQQSATFHQQVVYPASAIDSARSLVTQLEGQLQGVQQIYRLPINSATLPGPRQLETVLLSHSPSQISQINQTYGAIYGTVMAPNDAPQPVRDAVDMADAEAQAAMKEAMKLDALADIEIQAANKITQQLQSAAPGSAPILEAEAAALRVRAEAYTQLAMAELVRLNAIELAGGSADLKLAATSTSSLRGNMGGMLGRGAK